MDSNQQRVEDISMERLLAPLDSFLMNYSINRQFEEQQQQMQNQQINLKDQFKSGNPKSKNDLINYSCRTIHDLNQKLGQIINFQTTKQQNNSILTASSIQTILEDQNSFTNLNKFIKFCDKNLRQASINKSHSKQQNGNEVSPVIKNNQQIQQNTLTQGIMSQISSKTAQTAQSQNLQNLNQGKHFSQGSIIPTKQFTQKQQQSNIPNIGSLGDQQRQFSCSGHSNTTNKNINQTPSTKNDHQNSNNYLHREASQSLHTPVQVKDSEDQIKAIQQRIQEQISLQKDVYLSKLMSSQKSSAKSPEPKQQVEKNIPQLQIDSDLLNFGNFTTRSQVQGQNSTKMTYDFKRNKSQQLEQMKKLNSQRNNVAQKQQEKEILKKLFSNKSKPSNIFLSAQNSDLPDNLVSQSPTYPDFFQKQAISDSAFGINIKNNQMNNNIKNNYNLKDDIIRDNLNSNNNTNINDDTQQTTQTQQLKNQSPLQQVNNYNMSVQQIIQNQIFSSSQLLSNRANGQQINQAEQLSNKLTSQNILNFNGEVKHITKRSDSIHQNNGSSSSIQNNPLYNSCNQKQEETKYQQSPLIRPKTKSVHNMNNSPLRTYENGGLKQYQKQIYKNPHLQIMNSERLTVSRSNSKHLSPQSYHQNNSNINFQTLNTQGGWQKPLLTYESNCAKTQVTQSRGLLEGPEELKNLYFQLQKKQQQMGISNKDQNKENSKINTKVLSSTNKDIIELNGAVSPAEDAELKKSMKRKHSSFHNHPTNSIQQLNQAQLQLSSKLIGTNSPSLSCRTSPYMKSFGMPNGIYNNFTPSSHVQQRKNSTGNTNVRGNSKQGSITQRTSIQPSSRDNSNLRISHIDSSRNLGNEGIQQNNSVFLNTANENGQNMKLSDSFLKTLIGNNLNEERTISNKLLLNLSLLQQRNKDQFQQSYRLFDDKKKQETHRSIKTGSSNNISNKANTSNKKITQGAQIQNKQMKKSFSTHHSRNNSIKGTDIINKIQSSKTQQKQSSLTYMNNSKQQNNMPSTILMTEYAEKCQPEIKINQNVFMNNLINNSNNQFSQGVFRCSPQLLQNNNYTGVLNTELQPYNYNEFINTDQQQYTNYNTLMTQQNVFFNTLQTQQNTLQTQQNTLQTQQNEILSQQNTLNTQQNTLHTQQNTLPTQQNTIGGYLTDRTHNAQQTKQHQNNFQPNQQYIKQIIKNQIKGVSEIPTSGFTKSHKINSQYDQYVQQQLEDFMNARSNLKKSGGSMTQSKHQKTKSEIPGGQNLYSNNKVNYSNQSKGTLITKLTESNVSGLYQQLTSRQNSVHNNQQQNEQFNINQELNTDRNNQKPNSISQQQFDMYLKLVKQNINNNKRVQSAQKIQTSQNTQNYKGQTNLNKNQNINPTNKLQINNYAGTQPQNYQQKLEEQYQQTLQKRLNISPQMHKEYNQGGFNFNNQIFQKIQNREQNMNYQQGINNIQSQQYPEYIE